jgi:hypothetical protein
MDHLSHLEEAALKAGMALRAVPFGKSMAAYDPGRRGGPGAAPSELAGFELSAGPPVFRTLSVLDAASRTGRDLRLSDEDREYVRWIGEVQTALRSIADRFWGTIRPDVRQLVFDHDSVLIIRGGQAFIPGLRGRPGPSIHTACSRVGIGERELAALAECWHAAHSTEAYASARAADIRIRLHDGLRRSLIRERAALATQADSMLLKGLTLGVVGRQLARLAADAYTRSAPDVQRAAESIRSYNELIQAVLWTILGFSEQPREDQHPVPPGFPRVAVQHRWRHLEAHFTMPLTDSMPFPKVYGPVRIDGRGPLDGIYICLGYSLREGRGQGYVDFTGLLLRELERAPL